MNVINRITSFLLLVILLSNVFVSEIVPSRSSYSFNIGVLDCNNIEPLKGCRHEIGHKMDGDLGMPSLSTEFAIAFQSYVLVETRLGHMPSDLAMTMVLYPERDSRELYATIYAKVEGDVSKLPESLRVFYSDDPSYLDLYDCLAQTGLNICGRSISYLKGEAQ